MKQILFIMLLVFELVFHTTATKVVAQNLVFRRDKVDYTINKMNEFFKSERVMTGLDSKFKKCHLAVNMQAEFLETSLPIFKGDYRIFQFEILDVASGSRLVSRRIGLGGGLDMIGVIVEDKSTGRLDIAPDFENGEINILSNNQIEIVLTQIGTTQNQIQTIQFEYQSSDLISITIINQTQSELSQSFCRFGVEI